MCVQDFFTHVSEIGISPFTQLHLEGGGFLAWQEDSPQKSEKRVFGHHKEKGSTVTL